MGAPPSLTGTTQVTVACASPAVAVATRGSCGTSGEMVRDCVACGAAFQALLPDWSAVSVQVNDQPIVVPRRANRDLARFVVEADGSVR